MDCRRTYISLRNSRWDKMINHTLLYLRNKGLPYPFAILLLFSPFVPLKQSLRLLPTLHYRWQWTREEKEREGEREKEDEITAQRIESKHAPHDHICAIALDSPENYLLTRVFFSPCKASSIRRLFQFPRNERTEERRQNENKTMETIHLHRWERERETKQCVRVDIHKDTTNSHVSYFWVFFLAPFGSFLVVEVESMEEHRSIEKRRKTECARQSFCFDSYGLHRTTNDVNIVCHTHIICSEAILCVMLFVFT